MDEPTIYDYLKSLFDNETHINLPNIKTPIRVERKQKHSCPIKDSKGGKNWYKVILGCLFSISAQFFFEPKVKNVILAIVLYIISFSLLFSAGKSKKGGEQDHKKEEIKIEVKYPFLIISILSQILAFVLFGENRFNLLNTSLWIVGIVFLILAFWTPEKRARINKEGAAGNFQVIFSIVVCVIIFFRVFQINEVPGEMYSDHAEKLLDVMDISSGEFPVFFERNTGREPIQFYVTAFIAKVVGTGFSFLSLKIGTIAFGLLTLPFIYLFARDMSNKWVGLSALFLAGIAYWPNVISRVGLRYSLYPMFTAPSIYYLFKGLREKNLNSLLICGLFTGLGLLGYSSYRIIPLLIILITLIYRYSNYSKIKSISLYQALFIIGAVSLAVFIPLIRFWFDNPGVLSYRSLTRLTQLEKPFDEPALWIFIKNAVSSLLMPFINNGHIWVHSIPNRPALDFISGGFYFIGLVSLYIKIQSRRNPGLISLLVSIPILMMPSILSLAYPGENPSLNRSAGAYVPIFIIAGNGLFIFINAIKNIFKEKLGRIMSISISLIFSIFIIINNYNLVFNEYKEQFLHNAWNTSEIGHAIKEFTNSDIEERQAFVVPYPHWVDTRLVGFNAGFPGRDFALWRVDIPNLQIDSNQKIFIYKPEDIETKAVLNESYPSGETSIFYSKIDGKEFIIYTLIDIEEQ